MKVKAQTSPDKPNQVRFLTLTLSLFYDAHNIMFADFSCKSNLDPQVVDFSHFVALVSYFVAIFTVTCLLSFRGLFSVAFYSWIPEIVY